MTNTSSRNYSRRNFLKAAGIASLAGILASCAPAKPAPANQVESSAAEPEQPAVTPAVPDVVTIVYGRHDAIDGDVANVEAFQAKFPNIKVEQQQIAEFANQVPAMAAAGNLPDVFRSWEAMSLELARAGQMVDLQPMVDGTADFNPEDFL